MCTYSWDNGRSKGKKRCHEESSEKYHFTDAIVQQLLWNFSFSSLKEDSHSCKFFMIIFYWQILNSIALLPRLAWEMLSAGWSAALRVSQGLFFLSWTPADSGKVEKQRKQLKAAFVFPLPLRAIQTCVFLVSGHSCMVLLYM